MPRIVSEIVDVYAFRRRGEVIEFLTMHRSPGGRLGGTWQAVHGCIEPGETAWQAAFRELREETALTPVRFYQIDSVNTFYMAVEDTIHHCPCFAAEIAAGAEVRLNEEHDAYEWLPVDAALTRYPWPGQRRAVREILSEIVQESPARPFLDLADLIRNAQG